MLKHNTYMFTLTINQLFLFQKLSLTEIIKKKIMFKF